jgi:hypothetical protein
MRMWMCEPKNLCKKHLLGEHFEIHKHRHNFVKGYSIEGRRGQIEPMSMKKRHDELAKEMVNRGYNHNSPYEQPDLSHYNLDGFEVDKDAALKDLHNRCSECLEISAMLNKIKE